MPLSQAWARPSRKAVKDCGACICSPPYLPTPETFYSHSRRGYASYNQSFSGADDTWYLGKCGYRCNSLREGLQRNGFLVGGPSSSQSVGFVSFSGMILP